MLSSKTEREALLKRLCKKANGAADSRLIEEAVGRVSGHHLGEH